MIVSVLDKTVLLKHIRLEDSLQWVFRKMLAYYDNELQFNLSRAHDESVLFFSHTGGQRLF